ncbi:hypothetical protein TNIN_433481 [Trichonephila inaurata madagascariensis]|uniref:Uncharacterized protein n=1 Tax=Trichonephila inaurata madagascariensis TaxID=2747483 RepID=A0A8X7C1V1_9ARAC|nr:hypothetical protein TNIN_433481 [Trichonephila inaurata madagascariensis]
MQVIPFSCRRPHLLPHKVVWSGLPLAKCQKCGGDHPHFFLVVIKHRNDTLSLPRPFEESCLPEAAFKDVTSSRVLFHRNRHKECIELC